MKNFFSIILLFSASLPSYGSSCAFPDVDKLDKSQDVAFIGVVDRKLRDFSVTFNQFSIQVVDVYKGNLGSSVNIWTGNLSSCGVDFSPGERYVIFAKIRKGKMYVSISSAWIMTEGNSHLTSQFESFYKVKR